MQEETVGFVGAGDPSSRSGGGGKLSGVVQLPCQRGRRGERSVHSYPFGASMHYSIGSYRCRLPFRQCSDQLAGTVFNEN